jgi:hypothetical protein
MPRRVGQISNLCTVCRHVERGRLDFLIATGASLKPLAHRFSLRPSAIYNHAKKHVSDEYKRAVKIGPFQSEEHLRKLCAEAGGSVVDNLMAIYGGLASRWLVAFESGADATLSMLTTRMHQNLELRAKITKELLPPGPSSVTNIMLDPGYMRAVGRIAVALSPYPEARIAVATALRELGHGGAPLQIEAHGAGAND